MSSTLYFFGGFYGEGKNRKFAPVSPTASEAPYVYGDESEARSAFHLAKHHSDLYALNENEQSATVLQRGELPAHGPSFHGPNTVVLPSDVLSRLIRAPKRSAP